MDFSAIISSASADAGTNALIMNCKSTLRALFTPLLALFFETALAVGYIPSEAAEFAFSDFARSVAIRQLLCADIRHRVANKRLASARIRKAFRIICKECASVAILKSVSRKVAKIITRKLSEKLAKDFETHGRLGYDRDHNQAVVASIEQLAGYIKGERILVANTSRAVYVVIKFDHFGTTYYGVWEREYVYIDDGEYSCWGDYYDPNFLVAEKLYEATTSEEIIKITTCDLQKYIMNGRLFTSIDDIGTNALNIGCEFFVHFDKFRRNQRRAVAIATPSPGIQELISAGKPVTLRDLLVIIGHNNLSNLEGYKLGSYVCRCLPYKIRQKVEVTRSSQKMLVNLYTPDEFADIAFLVDEWIQRGMC